MTEIRGTKSCCNFVFSKMKNLQNRKHQIAIIFLVKLVTILCVMGSLFVAYECINKYSKGSTTLIVTRLKTSELEIKFPEFTICSAVSYKMGLLKNYNLTSKEEYLNNGIENMTWDIFDNLNTPVNQIIAKIALRSGKRFTTIFAKSDEFKNMSRFITVKRHGKCVAIEIPDKYLKENLNALIFMSSVEFLQIYIHYPGQFRSGPNTKVSAARNYPLYTDLKFNVLEDIPEKYCNPEVNGKGFFLNTKYNYQFCFFAFFTML